MPSLTTYALTPGSGDMALHGSRIPFRGLDELAPGLWRFAHAEMKVRDLDRVYSYFHEKFYPLERIADSDTTDSIILAMKGLLRRKAHLPENW